jgi:hypothetical protein
MTTTQYDTFHCSTMCLEHGWGVHHASSTLKINEILYYTTLWTILFKYMHIIWALVTQKSEVSPLNLWMQQIQVFCSAPGTWLKVDSCFKCIKTHWLLCVTVVWAIKLNNMHVYVVLCPIKSKIWPLKLCMLHRVTLAIGPQCAWTMVEGSHMSQVHWKSIKYCIILLRGAFWSIICML